MAKEPYLEAGKIINTFGVRGEVKLDPWCDSAEFLKPLKTLYIDGAPRAVASSRVHKGMLIVRFADVEDVNGAMLLKNKIVYFARSDVRLPSPIFSARRSWTSRARRSASSPRCSICPPGRSTSCRARPSTRSPPCRNLFLTSTRTRKRSAFI